MTTSYRLARLKVLWERRKLEDNPTSQSSRGRTRGTGVGAQSQGGGDTALPVLRLEIKQEAGMLYKLLQPEYRRALAFDLVWGKPPVATLTDVERRLVGCFEQLAKDLEQHDTRPE